MEAVTTHAIDETHGPTGWSIFQQEDVTYNCSSRDGALHVDLALLYWDAWVIHHCVWGCRIIDYSAILLRTFHREPVTMIDMSTLLLGSYYVQAETLTLKAFSLATFLFLFYYAGLKLHRLKKKEDPVKEGRNALFLLLFSQFPLLIALWVV